MTGLRIDLDVVLDLELAQDPLQLRGAVRNERSLLPEIGRHPQRVVDHDDAGPTALRRRAWLRYAPIEQSALLIVTKPIRHSSRTRLR